MTERTIEPPDTGRTGPLWLRSPVKAATGATGALLGLHTPSGPPAWRVGGTPSPGPTRADLSPR